MNNAVASLALALSCALAPGGLTASEPVPVVASNAVLTVSGYLRGIRGQPEDADLYHSELYHLSLTLGALLHLPRQ